MALKPVGRDSRRRLCSHGDRHVRIAPAESRPSRAAPPCTPSRTKTRESPVFVAVVPRVRVAGVISISSAIRDRNSSASTAARRRREFLCVPPAGPASRLVPPAVSILLGAGVRAPPPSRRLRRGRTKNPGGRTRVAFRARHRRHAPGTRTGRDRLGHVHRRRRSRHLGALGTPADFTALPRPAAFLSADSISRSRGAAPGRRCPRRSVTRTIFTVVGR